jgi:hypothetical protein
VGFPSLASEFPNDNAEISGGAIWIGAELTGPARLELAPYQPVKAEAFVLFFDDEEGELELDGPLELEMSTGSLSLTVHEPEPLHENEPQHVEPVNEIAVATAFAHFEAALAAALMAQGASRAAALLPRLLRLEPLPADTVAKEVWLTLQSRGYLDSNGRYSQKFRDLCTAWSAVLQGSSQDFAACGTTTLDRFGADLLAALLAVPATRADELRRQLRKAGIAAFGVLHAA